MGGMENANRGVASGQGPRGDQRVGQVENGSCGFADGQEAEGLPQCGLRGGNGRAFEVWARPSAGSECAVWGGQWAGARCYVSRLQRREGARVGADVEAVGRHGSGGGVRSCGRMRTSTSLRSLSRVRRLVSVPR